MPPLARAKARVGAALRSHATVAEGRQNILCAYLSGVLLVGLLANALAGAWWLDSVAALVIGALAVKEGIGAWQGEECESCGCRWPDKIGSNVDHVVLSGLNRTLR
jgi:hypothetical protein